MRNTYKIRYIKNNEKLTFSFLSIIMTILVMVIFEPAHSDPARYLYPILDGDTSDSSSQIPAFLKGVDSKSTANNYYAVIEGNAINDSRGIIMINQSAGNLNSQLNSTRVTNARNIKNITDNELSVLSVASRSRDSLEQKKSTANMEIKVDKSALSGAQGVIQINQAAGGRNISHNNFILQDLSRRQ